MNPIGRRRRFVPANGASVLHFLLRMRKDFLNDKQAQESADYQ
jgi:hypothetical protein